MDGDVRTLARLIRQQARRVEREAHTLRQMAARLEEAASDTSTEDTDHDEDVTRTPDLQAV